MKNANNDWELLVEADDIQPGDMVEVEEECAATTMRFKAYKRGLVYLIDSEGTTRSFRADSLEENNGSAYIVGKVED